MDNKKIKKSSATLGGILFSFIIAIGIFMGMFLYMNEYTKYGQGFNDPVYNDSYTRLNANQNELNNSMNEMRDNAVSVTEVGEDFGSAWNGLKGLLRIYQIPLRLINTGITSAELITAPIAGIIPVWVMALAVLGILIFILLIIVAIFKGDSNVIR